MTRVCVGGTGQPLSHLALHVPQLVSPVRAGNFGKGERQDETFTSMTQSLASLVVLTPESHPGPTESRLHFRHNWGEEHQPLLLTSLLRSR